MSLQSCDHDLGTWKPACNYDSCSILQSHDCQLGSSLPFSNSMEKLVGGYKSLPLPLVFSPRWPWVTWAPPPTLSTPCPWHPFACSSCQSAIGLACQAACLQSLLRCCDHMKSLLNDLHGLHLSTATGIAGIAITNWCGCTTLCFMTISLSNINSSPYCAFVVEESTNNSHR